MPSTQGHVVVRVEQGGGSYRVIVLDDSKPDGAVRSVISRTPGGFGQSDDLTAARSSSS